jgi:hypothetical protein
MSETSENAAPAADNGTATVKEAKTDPVRKAFGVLKRHPLGIVALAGAAVALVEVELAVGILAGIGATALLALKSGPEARQEVLAKGQEVLAKGKSAVERARAIKLRKEPAEAAANAASPPPAA